MRILAPALFAMLLSSITPATPAAAEPASGRLRLTPHLGVGTYGDYYDGQVVFSSGDREFLAIEPGAGLLLGVQLAYSFTERIAGYLGIAYVSSEADYVERDNVRPDVDLQMLEIDLGVLFEVVSFGSAAKPSGLGLGGGLSIVNHEIDGLVWDGRRTDPSQVSVGVHGLGALDIGLTDLLALRVQLELGLMPLRFGNLERELAIADDEADADLEGETMTYAELSVGLTFRL